MIHILQMRNRKQDEAGSLAAAAGGGLYTPLWLKSPLPPRPQLFWSVRDSEPQAQPQDLVKNGEPQSNRRGGRWPDRVRAGCQEKGRTSEQGTPCSPRKTPSLHAHRAQAAPHAHPRGLTNPKFQCHTRTSSARTCQPTWSTESQPGMTWTSPL